MSAYLRTLAYAMYTGTLRADEAEYHAMLALPMNRGLAALEPVDRPAWSRNLVQRWRDSGRTLVNELWAQAATHCGAGETPAALRLAEACEKDFIEVEVDLVVGHGAFANAKPEAESPKYAWDDADAGSLAGDLRLREGALGPVTGPLTSACPVAPEHVGRVETTVDAPGKARVSRTRLASGESPVPREPRRATGGQRSGFPLASLVR